MPTVSCFEVIYRSNVCFVFSVDLDGGYVHHRFLAGALYGALGLYPTVAWGICGYMGVTQHFLVVCLDYCSHVFCTTVWQFDGVFVAHAVECGPGSQWVYGCPGLTIDVAGRREMDRRPHKPKYFVYILSSIGGVITLV